MNADKTKGEPVVRGFGSMSTKLICPVLIGVHRRSSADDKTSK